MKKIILIIYTVLLGIIVDAQPLAPSTPSGNSIPVSNFGGILALVAGIVVFIYLKSKQQKEKNTKFEN